MAPFDTPGELPCSPPTWITAGSYVRSNTLNARSVTRVTDTVTVNSLPASTSVGPSMLTMTVGDEAGSAILRDRLLAAELLTQAELETMDAEVRQEVQAAADFAEAAPDPDPATLYEHVYADINPNGRLFFDGRDRGTDV